MQTDDPAQPVNIENIGTADDFLAWVKEGVVPAVYSSSKYNEKKMELWERNYLSGYNKVIGGVFMLQARRAGLCGLQSR